MARPEKPAEQRRNRSANRREWTVLPFDGREGPAPKLPAWREWDRSTLDWWDELWASPQAVMWDQSGRTLHALAILQDDLIVTARKPGASSSAALTTLVAQMRQIQARHGLDPRAMADMKWRVGEPGERVGGTVVQLVPEPPRPDPAGMPAKRASKAEWVDWAVACGIDRAAAVKVSKAKLIAEFSSIAPSAERPSAVRPVSLAVERVKAAQRSKEPVKKKPRGRR